MKPTISATTLFSKRQQLENAIVAVEQLTDALERELAANEGLTVHGNTENHWEGCHAATNRLGAALARYNQLANPVFEG